MMQVTQKDRVIVCAVCERTLLLGEQITRFRDDEQEYDVCPLCVPRANAIGWLREGAPSPPPPMRSGARVRQGFLARLFGRPPKEEPPLGAAPAPQPRPAPPEPPASALPRSGPERTRALEEQRARAAEEAVATSLEAFNRSAYPRTLAGISRTLGRPRVSVVPLSGTRPDVVVTVAWDLSWYQFRVDADAAPPVRLTAKGDDADDEVEARWRDWNAHADVGGMLRIGT